MYAPPTYVHMCTVAVAVFSLRSSAARERHFERELEDMAALHKAQLTAYDKIESQGGTLNRLASEVKESAEALTSLRERMDAELWKGVLKVSAARRWVDSHVTY